MANKIKLLPEIVANQIAAGEVVEGPSSIIKELFENSVDAGASKIDIIVSKNFLKIELIDNGDGISKEDLPIAFKKHATSKISSIEDLQKIQSFGFRGEALPSISSVSKLTCISRTKDSDKAYKLYIENEIEDLSETGFSYGTKIIVDDLFFNTPARLKFLKSSNKERNLIIDTCRGLALANPSLAVKLDIDGKTLLKSSGSGDLRKAIEEILQKSIADNLLNIKAAEKPITVKGFCSKLTNTRTDKRGLFTIVNGRFLDCYIIKSAIQSVYKDLLDKSKYPIAIINIELPAEDIDVNVHPNKKEIKYHETNKLYRLVQNAIDKALQTNAHQEHEKISETKIEFNESTSSNKVSQEKLDTKAFTSFKAPENPLKDFKPSFKSINKFEEKPESSQEESFNFNSSKFLARFGSIDIKKVDNTEVQTLTSSLGNKTKFEYAHKDLKNNQSIIFSGDYVGENWLKEKLFSFLADIGDEILDRERHKEKKENTHSRPTSKPSNKILEKIWQRDNYTCVYCGKALLSPDLIKEKIKACTKPDELNEHLASYDHHLPASKYGELNKAEENLYAVCQSCNIKKSDSLASKTWTPNVQNAWTKSISIAGLELDKPELN